MALQKKIKGAMTYPAICLGISIIILAVILIFVVPVFDKMFQDFSSTPPVPTQMVVNMSNFVKSNFIFMLLGLVLLVWVCETHLQYRKVV